MTPDDREHILVLLCAIVLADKRVRPIEVETFSALIRGLDAEFRELAPPPEEDTAAWFLKNRANVAAMLAAPDREARLVRHFLALDGFAYKRQLLEAMESIAVSDRELHDAEFDLMLLAAAYWDLPPPKRG